MKFLIFYPRLWVLLVFLCSFVCVCFFSFYARLWVLYRFIVGFIGFMRYYSNPISMNSREIQNTKFRGSIEIQEGFKKKIKPEFRDSFLACVICFR